MKTWHILVLVVSVACVGFLTAPLVGDVKVLRHDIERKQVTLQEKIDELQTVNAIVQELAQQNRSVLEEIPLDTQQENILRDLQRIASRTGFGFSSLAFSRGQNQTLSLPELKVSFSTQGQLANLKPFLLLIEENERFMGLESLSVNTVMKDGSPHIAFAVQLYSFFQQ